MVVNSRLGCWLFKRKVMMDWRGAICLPAIHSKPNITTAKLALNIFFSLFVFVCAGLPLQDIWEPFLCLPLFNCNHSPVAIIQNNKRACVEVLFGRFVRSPGGHAPQPVISFFFSAEKSTKPSVGKCSLTLHAPSGGFQIQLYNVCMGHCLFVFCYTFFIFISSGFLPSAFLCCNTSRCAPRGALSAYKCLLFFCACPPYPLFLCLPPYPH